MSKFDFNNVYVYKGNKKISIALHWEGSTSLTQEIGIIHKNKNIDIKLYTNTLDSLIETLIEIRKELSN